MVMPRFCSSARESVWVLPSSTLPISSMTPAAYSSRSVKVVLPASTCARIPRFKVPIELHVLQIGGSYLLNRHESSAHLLLLVSFTVTKTTTRQYTRGVMQRFAGWD